MAWLEWTEADSADMQFALACAGGMILVIGLMTLFVRSKRKPEARPTSIAEDIYHASWGVVMVFVLFAGDILERHGVSELGVFAITMGAIAALTAPALVIAHRRMKALQDTGVTNPASGAAAPVPPSPEERKVERRMWAALALFAVVGIGPFFLFIGGDRLAASGWLAAAFFYALAGLLFLTFVTFGRWPGEVRKRQFVEINAPRETVWAAMRYRETTGWWSPAVRRIDRLPGAGEIYRMRYYNLDPCPECGLPHPPDTPASEIDVEVLEETRGERLVIRSSEVPAKAGASPVLRGEMSTYLLSDLPGGRTRVDLLSLADRPRTWFAVLLMLGDAPGEHLRAMQGAIEGKNYETLTDTAAQRIAAARKAEKYCGCAAEA